MRCETAIRGTVAVYAFLVAAIAAVAVGMIFAAAIAWNGGLLLGGIAFGAFGVYQGHELLYSTAHVFAIDPAQQVLVWKSVLGSGSVPIGSLGAITKAPNRPGVYVFRVVAGGSVPFWLSNRDEQVHEFFRTVRAMNPDLDVSELYRRGRIWSKGL